MTLSHRLPHRSFRTVFCLACVLFSVGCASVPQVESRLKGLQFHPNLYVVQANDTIDSIAWRYRLSPMDLVALNPGLEKGPKPGQRLNVVPGTEMSDAVREGRSPTQTAQVDIYGNPLEAQARQNGGWPAPSQPADYPPQNPAADAYGQPAEQAATRPAQQPAYGDEYARGSEYAPESDYQQDRDYGQATVYPPARTAAVEPQPRIDVQRIDPNANRQYDQPERNSGQRAPEQRATQDDTYADTRPQVTSEVRASARGPIPSPGSEPSPSPSDESLLNDSPLPAAEAEDERVAMVAPDAGGWPREEIVPDDLDFAPVEDGSGEPEAEDGFSGRWAWPTKGQIVRGFQPDRVGGQGVDIAGVPGQDVMAAMDGTVVYSGRDLSGEGNLIILRHPDELLSTYSHTRNLYVAEDDVVRAGDSIASLGANEDQESVLGFEIRRDGNPLNPMDFLPVR